MTDKAGPYLNDLADPFDAIVVGSGAAGGMSAYVLAKAGAKVLVLEAGRDYDPERETPMFNLPQEAPLRGAPTPEKPAGYYDATVGGGWDVPGEPYAVASGSTFRWWRARMLGGRTNHWGRISLRFGPYDFKPRRRDGLGFDWPIDYEEIAPYYDKVEALIGVFGGHESLENAPASSPGVLLPPPKPRTHELLVQKVCAGLGMPVVANHAAVLTRPLNGRRACFYATSCNRGCAIKANFQSTTVLLPPARMTGNLSVATQAAVHEVAVDQRGLASGVYYVDRTTGEHKFVAGRSVVLAASALESARILLNSKSGLFPNGLANGSGFVGKYIMDTVGSLLDGQFPVLENLPPHNQDGASVAHVYVPWWDYAAQAAGKLGFPRPYHIELGGGRRMPNMDTFSSLGRVAKGTYGRQLKEDARRFYGSFVRFSGRGEMIPNEQSYCELDPELRDRWGIPVLRIHWQWSDHEYRQAAHMQETFAQIIAAGGGRCLKPPALDGRNAISIGGSIIHEVGGVRMGDAPTNSVLNAWNQSWEVRNLFVVDGGAFMSNADKNPTLTILALAWRASEHLLRTLRDDAP
jgi:choline dehydrogenase-like flavoprotein